MPQAFLFGRWCLRPIFALIAHFRCLHLQSLHTSDKKCYEGAVLPPPLQPVKSASVDLRSALDTSRAVSAHAQGHGHQTAAHMCWPAHGGQMYLMRHVQSMSVDGLLALARPRPHVELPAHFFERQDELLGRRRLHRQKLVSCVYVCVWCVLKYVCVFAQK